MDTENLVGARCTGTFIDRGGRVVLQFEGERVVGVGQNLRLEAFTRQIRVLPQNLIEIGADSESCNDDR